MGRGLCTFDFWVRICGVLACFVALMSVGRAAPDQASAPQRCELVRLGRDEGIKHNTRVTSASFNPDSSKVITASLDGTARIKDLIKR